MICLLIMVPIYIASATSTTIAVNPPTSYVTVGAAFSVDINITNVANLTSWQFIMYFLNSVINCTGVTEGPFLKTGGGSTTWPLAVNITNNYNSTHGRVLGVDSLFGNFSVNGGGVLATVSFKALTVGDTSLHLSDTKLGDEKIPPQPIAHTDNDGTVHVQNFSLTTYTVGSGSVTRNNTGPYYHYLEAVQLTATPATGWSFDHWSGNLTGSANPATLTITGNMTVNATFTQDQYTLTTNTVGSGSVGKSPNQATYTWGTNVTLTASAGVGWSFAGWSGDASGSVSPTIVNMTGNKVVNATFTQNVYTLTTLVDGSGSVTLNNTGPYHYGDAVQLTASATVGWTFYYWTVDLSGSDNPATLVMTDNFSVTAHFVLKPTLEMSPTNKTCRIYGENLTVTVNISDAVNVEDFEFEIHYNATLLRYVNVTWNAWGSGTINVNETSGIITGSTSGAPLNGTQSAVTIQFQAACHHVWKDAPGWTNDLTDTIFIQSANLSYPTGPKLRYEKGGLNQINVGPDFVYTFSPIPGDVNNDGTVDIFDLRSVAAYYNVKQGDPNWTEASTYDLNGDGIIDITDLRIAAAYFGYTYNP